MEVKETREGIGHFSVIGQRGDEMHLTINVPAGTRSSPAFETLPVRQRQADRLERHPDQSVAVFRLFDNDGKA